MSLSRTIASTMAPRNLPVSGQIVPSDIYFIRNILTRTYLELPNPDDGSQVFSALGADKATQWWKVIKEKNGTHSIVNFGSSSYARCSGTVKGSAVVCGQGAVSFLINEYTMGRYTIRLTARDVDLYWGLPDSEHGKPVQLDPRRSEQANQWSFTPVTNEQAQWGEQGCHHGVANV
ncbi:hypothetical protein BD410DRAFT_794994 [Rickenella mellea]|uniref:Ricin B lectin domain-containing protein n=1 Tax=Rickenella mellea TaxID=50990 RepID=A0A4Y7PQF2_9AGAM|nr:hypothetical protein BD410DRAFT_794994 [Rickenella mellea]